MKEDYSAVITDERFSEPESGRNPGGRFISTDKRLIAEITGSSYYNFIPYNSSGFRREDGISIEEEDAHTLLLLMMCVDEKVDKYDTIRLENERWLEIIEHWRFVLFQAESFDQVFEKLLIVDYERGVVGCERMLYFMNNYGKVMWDNRISERALCDNFMRWFDLVSKHCQGIEFVGL